MGALLFISLGILMFLGLPLLTYFYAKHLGRHAGRWFLIGILLPGLATIILSFLPDKTSTDENAQKIP